MIKEIMLYNVIEGKNVLNCRPLSINEIRKAYGQIRKLEFSGKRVVKVAKIVLQRNDGTFQILGGE